jgi:hypothetical protein
MHLDRLSKQTSERQPTGYLQQIPRRYPIGKGIFVGKIDRNLRQRIGQDDATGKHLLNAPSKPNASLGIFAKMRVTRETHAVGL